jgi:hypothetical protein
MATNNALQNTQVTLNNTHMNHLKGGTFSAQQKEENKSMKATHSRLLTVHYHWDWCGTGLSDVAIRVGININSLSFWYWSFTFSSIKSPTWCNNLSVHYPDVCLLLNMFRAFSRPSSGARWLQWQPLVLPSYRGDSRAVSGPTTNTARLSPWYEGKTRGCHCSHRAPDDGRENARNMLSSKQTSG